MTGKDNAREGTKLGKKKTTENWRSVLSRSTMAELLRDFFTYYARFDFNRDVVCPLLGRVVSKRDLMVFIDPQKGEEKKMRLPNLNFFSLIGDGC